MNKSVQWFWAPVLLIATTIEAQAAADALPPALRGVGFDQRLNEQIPLDAEFRDEAGRVVRLGDYFGRRPVILVLAYYRCPMLCTEVLNGLVRALLDVPLQLGRDFDVLTVSFDPREGPALAAAKRATYLERYGHRGDASNWHFLTGTQTSIDRLTHAVGFRYYYDAKNDQFVHASGIMILTPAGRIARYFYDISYSPRDIRLGLVEASAGKIGLPTDPILLFCFHYDPRLGKYGLAVMNVVRACGVITVLAIIGLVVRLRRASGRPLATGNG